MSSIFRIEHEVKSSHQLRAYGDTIYEGFITYSVPEGQMVGSKWNQSDTAIEKVKADIRHLVVAFDDEMLPDRWHVPQLKSLKQVSPGRWHYRIERVYLD